MKKKHRTWGFPEAISTPDMNRFLEAAWKGDSTAFSQPTEPIRLELHIHSYRMLGNIEDAEDMGQERFLHTWRSFEKYERRASFRAWESADLDGILALLAEDAAFPMPPLLICFQGKPAIRRLRSETILSGNADGRWKLFADAATFGNPALFQSFHFPPSLASSLQG